MMYMKALETLCLKFDNDNNWYIRHPTQPNLLFYGSKKQLFAKAMKDKQIRKSFPVTLGFDMMASKDWEVVRVTIDENYYLTEVTVLDPNT